MLAAHFTCYNKLFNKSEQSTKQTKSTEQTICSLLYEKVDKAVNSKCLPKHLGTSFLQSWKCKFPLLDVVEYLNSEICGFSNDLNATQNICIEVEVVSIWPREGKTIIE